MTVIKRSGLSETEGKEGEEKTVPLQVRSKDE